MKRRASSRSVSATSTSRRRLRSATPAAADVREQSRGPETSKSGLEVPYIQLKADTATSQVRFQQKVSLYWSQKDADTNQNHLGTPSATSEVRHEVETILTHLNGVRMSLGSSITLCQQLLSWQMPSLIMPENENVLKQKSLMAIELEHTEPEDIMEPKQRLSIQKKRTALVQHALEQAIGSLKREHISDTKASTSKLIESGQNAIILHQQALYFAIGARRKAGHTLQAGFRLLSDALVCPNMILALSVWVGGEKRVCREAATLKEVGQEGVMKQINKNAIKEGILDALLHGAHKERLECREKALEFPGRSINVVLKSGVRIEMNYVSSGENKSHNQPIGDQESNGYSELNAASDPMLMLLLIRLYAKRDAFMVIREWTNWMLYTILIQKEMQRIKDLMGQAVPIKITIEPLLEESLRKSQSEEHVLEGTLRLDIAGKETLILLSSIEGGQAVFQFEETVITCQSLFEFRETMYRTITRILIHHIEDVVNDVLIERKVAKLDIQKTVGISPFSQIMAVARWHSSKPQKLTVKPMFNASGFACDLCLITEKGSTKDAHYSQSSDIASWLMDHI